MSETELRTKVKTSEYCNRWGTSQPLKILFENIIKTDSSRKTAAKISRIYHRYNFYFNILSRSNLPILAKHDLLLDLVLKYKRILFIETEFLTKKQKDSLFYHVMGKK